MIQEDYVSFEIAKLLKEKGFDEYGMYFYTLKDNGREGYKSNKRLGEFAHNSNPELKDRAVSCPTLQMAMKWLREEKKIFIDIVTYTTSNNIQFRWVGYDNGRLFSQEEGKTIYFNSYEEAVEAAIKYCLKNLI